MSNAPQTSPPPPPPPFVWWALWAAFQIGIVVIYFFLTKSSSTSSRPEPAPWVVALLPVLISGALRWSLLPKITDAVRALPIFVVGIAMAEATCFIGIFVFPAHKLILFCAAFIGILQYMPLFASRLVKPGNPE